MRGDVEVFPHAKARESWGCGGCTMQRAPWTISIGIEVDGRGRPLKPLLALCNSRSLRTYY